MAPLPIPGLVARGVPTRASLSVEGDILEAWAEGFNVGALIILILIVLCNIKRGVWLHKLILLEVCFSLDCRTPSVVNATTVNIGNMAWHLHLLSGSRLWLVSPVCPLSLETELMISQVSKRHGDSALHFISAAQHHILAEDQEVLTPLGQPAVHSNNHCCATLLDC